LQKVARLLAEGRINVASISLSSFKQKSFIRLVVSDPERALWLLRKAGYKADADELIVVSMEDKAGSLEKVLDVLSAHRLNVDSATILVTRDGKKVLIGLGVSSPERAKKMLLDAGFITHGTEGLITNAGLISSNVVYRPTDSVGLLL